jgi:hypothetical protein
VLAGQSADPAGFVVVEPPVVIDGVDVPGGGGAFPF